MRNKYGALFIAASLSLATLAMGCASKAAAIPTTSVAPVTTSAVKPATTSAAVIIVPTTSATAIPTTSLAAPTTSVAVIPPTTSVAPPSSTTAAPTTSVTPPVSTPTTPPEPTKEVNPIVNVLSPFTPINTNISKGKTVEFENTDHQDHTIICDYPFKTNITEDGIFEFTFDKVGIFHFYDEANPNTIGTITVS